MRLTPTELAILELLAGQAGRPVTLRQIIATVWKGAPATTADTVRVHVGSLRRKLEPDPANPRYIGTEPWVGYRFLAEPLEPRYSPESLETLSISLRTSFDPFGRSLLRRIRPMDIAFIALTISFFAASWGFVRLCASLEPAQEEKK